MATGKCVRNGYTDGYGISPMDLVDDSYMDDFYGNYRINGGICSIYIRFKTKSEVPEGQVKFAVEGTFPSPKGTNEDNGYAMLTNSLNGCPMFIGPNGNLNKNRASTSIPADTTVFISGSYVMK